MRFFWIFIFVFSLCLNSYGQSARWLVKLEYENICPFSDGIAIVQSNGKFGYIDINGNEILPPNYENVYDFKEGVGVISSINDEVKYIADRHGNLKKVMPGFSLNPQFPYFSNGLLLVKNEEGKHGYLNKTGKLVIDCKFSWAHPFCEGRSAVSLNKYAIGQWAYIGTDGRVLINTENNFQWASSFQDDKAVVIIKNKLAYINRDGKVLKNEELPKLTSLLERYDSFLGIIKCKEGQVFFREDVVMDKLVVNGDTTFFHKTVEEKKTALLDVYADNNKFGFRINGKKLPAQFDNIKWHDNERAIVQSNGKQGLLELSQNDMLAVSFKSDTVYSVFRNPTPATLIVQNQVADELRDIEITFPDGSSQHIDKLKTNGQREIEWLVKPDRLNASKEIVVNISCDGIKHNPRSFRVFIMDKPSLCVTFPTDTFQLGETNKTTVSCSLINKSAFNADNVKVRFCNSISHKTVFEKEMSIDAESTVDINFSLTSKENKDHTRKLDILIVPPNNIPEIQNEKVIIIKRAFGSRENISNGDIDTELRFEK